MATTTRKGRQDPTTERVLPYKKTYGKEAVEAYEKSGRTLMQWQRKLLNKILAYDTKEKLWVHTRYGYEVPRRNGKGEVLIAREIWGLLNGEKILHTAHRVTTSHSAYERISDILVKCGVEFKQYKALGQEKIELESGGRIDFRTRSERGGLGEGFDLLVIDEAQEYTQGQESALKYIVTDSSNPQTILCGTPPTAVSAGTVFPKYRDNALNNDIENAGWAEWSVEQMTDQNDRDAWYETNPALGYHLKERAVQDECGGDDIDFNIQRLGLWLKYNQKSVISRAAWSALKTEKPPEIIGQLHVGIKFAFDGKSVSMAIAVKQTNGDIFIEVIDNRPITAGYQWMLNFIQNAAINNVVVDGANGQKAIEEAMKGMKLRPPTLPTVREIVAASAGFEQAIYAGAVHHFDQPSLTEVATACDHRTIGTSGGFGYKSLVTERDISLLDACVLAHWSCAHEKPHKKQIIGY